MNCRFPVENGCKDTTIFHSGKIFFQKNFLNCLNALIDNTEKLKLFFTHSPCRLRKTARGTPKSHKIRLPGCGTAVKKGAISKYCTEYQFGKHKSAAFEGTELPAARQKNASATASV